MFVVGGKESHGQGRVLQWMRLQKKTSSHLMVSSIWSQNGGHKDVREDGEFYPFGKRNSYAYVSCMC